jgi:hypothetical protein
MIIQTADDKKLLILDYDIVLKHYNFDSRKPVEKSTLKSTHIILKLLTSDNFYLVTNGGGAVTVWGSLTKLFSGNPITPIGVTELVKKDMLVRLSFARESNIRSLINEILSNETI